MTGERWTSRAATPAEASILHHPDRRSAWVIGVVVRLTAGGLDPAVAARRLAALTVAHPILCARYDGRRWIRGLPCELRPLEGDPRVSGVLGARIDLAHDGPLRVRLSADGRVLVLAGHHGALDGRALLALAAGLLGVTEAQRAVAGPASTGRRCDPPSLGPGRTAREALGRLARPADRVAPSATAAREALVAADVSPAVRLRVATLAAAAVAAAGAWNRERGARWRRIGLTIPVGGLPVVGNVSTHRRVDLGTDADVRSAVTAALAAEVPPVEAASPRAALRLPATVIDRFSDSLLVSNLGRLQLPDVEAVDFFPVARGRSAVALGAATVDGGAGRVTLRARDLDAAGAQQLLTAIIEHLEGTE